MSEPVKWYCYIIANGPHTYNGSTNDPVRRLRQHNGEISGGARATSRVGPGWRYVALLGGFTDHVNTLQCEWRIKHPSGRPGRRDAQWCGVGGRIRGLGHVLRTSTQWTSKSTVVCDDLHLTLWIDELWVDMLIGEELLPAYVEVVVVEDLYINWMKALPL